MRLITERDFKEKFVIIKMVIFRHELFYYCVNIIIKIIILLLLFYIPLNIYCSYVFTKISNNNVIISILICSLNILAEYRAILLINYAKTKIKV